MGIWKKNLVLMWCLGISLAAHAATPPICDDFLTRTVQVPLTDLVVQTFKTGNIHDLVAALEAKYDAVNFRIPMGTLLGGRTVFILQERSFVGRVMREESKLPFVNRNFDISHGHFTSINSVNTTDPLWDDLHNGLDQIFKGKDIAPILEKYKSLLIGDGQSELTYNLNSTLEEFYMRVWAEYCFGVGDFEKFRGMRGRLIKVLGQVFHQNRFNRLPLLGYLTSEALNWKYSDDLQTVDQELREIVSQAIEQKAGVFYELYARLKPKYANAEQITLDNSFLAVLVYDFIHIVMLDALAHIAKDPSLDREAQIKVSRHNGFLYPFRFRIVEQDFDHFHKGDFVVVNLQKAGLYFSAGKRFCPGATLFGEIAKQTLAIYSGHALSFVDPRQEIRRSANRDLPFMESSHEVRVCPFRGESQ